MVLPGLNLGIDEDAFEKEADLERRFVRRCERAGATVRKLAWLGRKGAPDRVVMRPVRRIAFVELKRGSRGRFSSEQESELALLKALGFPVFKVLTDADLEAFAREFLDAL